MASLFRSTVVARRILATSTASRISPGMSTQLQLQRIAIRFQHHGVNSPYEKREKVGDKQFAVFDLSGKVFVVTGAYHICFSLYERLTSV